MWDNPFNPEWITIIDYKIVKGHIEAPEEFDLNGVEVFNLDNSLTLSFHEEKTLIKSDYSIDIATVSPERNKVEATGSFHLLFVFNVENLESLMIQEGDSEKFDPRLIGSLAAVTYSTVRGILLTRMQGTAFQNFILPVIDVGKLFNN